MRTEPQVLWQLVEPPIAGAGLDLIELQWNREGEGWVLRVFIDRPEPPHLPGASEPPADVLPRLTVSHEDCERVSRDLSAALDVADVIHHTYKLEVSSPGIDRPLRREQDFRRFAGQPVKIRCTEPSEGRRNFSGVLRGAENGRVEVLRGQGVSTSRRNHRASQPGSGLGRGVSPAGGQPGWRRRHETARARA